MTKVKPKSRPAKTQEPEAPPEPPITREQLCEQLAKSDVRRAQLRATPTEANKAKELAGDVYRQQEYELFGMSCPPRGAGKASGASGHAPTSEVLVKDETKEVSVGAKGGKRYDLFGHPVTSVIRWMGKAGWDKAKAIKCLAKLGVECSETTVAIQVRAGAKGDASRGDPAALSPAQTAQLEEAAK